ncbi:Aldehyde dehydrogenase domain protein, partial [mine drainage metagenome]
TVGAPLVAHPSVRMVSLTGDVSTGQKVLAAAAGNLKRTHLELGGKAPVIICADADLAAVASAIRVLGSITPDRIAPQRAACTWRRQSTTVSSRT